MDATKLLEKQHEEVRDLFHDYRKLDGGDRQEKLGLFREIKKKLEIHARIEEEIFDPPLRRAREKDMRQEVAEAYEEHHLIQTVLRELSSVDPAGETEFGAKMQVLQENVEHHADEEEDEMFSDAPKAFSKEQLEDFGRQLEARTQELERSYETAVVQ